MQEASDMNQANFDEAREAEENYHSKLYSENEILEPGTWMSKPIPIVMEMLERLLSHKDHINVLDLGCGAGRNAIPLALRLKGSASKVVGVDLLDEAINKLRDNAKEYGVSDIIHVEQGDVEHSEIAKNDYDYILACGCLEHLSSEEAFYGVLKRMKLGTRIGGINCIAMNTNVREIAQESGRELNPLIELNLPTEKAFAMLEKVYLGWNILDEKRVLLSIEEEKYDTPSEFRSQSITFVVQRIS
jgi:SAM-dependent methyltransferase